MKIRLLPLHKDQLLKKKKKKPYTFIKSNFKHRLNSTTER